MALSQQDISQIQKILSDKMSDKAMNKVIDQANKASFYYDLQDSPLNRPTLAKVLALGVMLMSFWISVIYPLFFAEKANLTSLANKTVESQISRWGMPPISSFTYNVNLKDYAEQGTNEKKLVLEVTDTQWNLLSKVDIVNGFGKATFGKLSDTLVISKADRDKIMNLSRYELEEDKKESIKELLDSALQYDKTKPDFKSIDYGVDVIINGSTN